MRLKTSIKRNQFRAVPTVYTGYITYVRAHIFLKIFMRLPRVVIDFIAPIKTGDEQMKGCASSLDSNDDGEGGKGT